MSLAVLINKFWRNWSRAIVVAILSLSVILIFACIEIPKFWVSKEDVLSEGAPIAVAIENHHRLLLEWLYLCLAGFFSTAFCAAVFEYAHRTKRLWISMPFLVLSPLILLFAGSVAYLPFSEEFERGWTVNLGINPIVPFIAGIPSLILAMIWRWRVSRKNQFFEGV
jgi:hypothetical protein